MKKLYLFILCFGILFSTSNPVMSQAHGDGVLTNSYNEPISNAQIIMQYNGEKSVDVDTVYTNIDGEFSFDNMTVVGMK